MFSLHIFRLGFHIEVVLWLNFLRNLCVVFRGGSPHAEILCMQPTGKLAYRKPGLQFSLVCAPATCSLPLQMPTRRFLYCVL